MLCAFHIPFSDNVAGQKKKLSFTEEWHELPEIEPENLVVAGRLKFSSGASYLYFYDIKRDKLYRLFGKFYDDTFKMNGGVSWLPLKNLVTKYFSLIKDAPKYALRENYVNAAKIIMARGSVNAFTTVFTHVEEEPAQSREFAINCEKIRSKIGKIVVLGRMIYEEVGIPCIVHREFALTSHLVDVDYEYIRRKAFSAGEAKGDYTFTNIRDMRSGTGFYVDEDYQKIEEVEINVPDAFSLSRVLSRPNEFLDVAYTTYEGRFRSFVCPWRDVSAYPVKHMRVMQDLKREKDIGEMSEDRAYEFAARLLDVEKESSGFKIFDPDDVIDRSCVQAAVKMFESVLPTVS